MEFVVNEWLPEYFLRSATSDQKKMLSDFLQKFGANYDRIIVHKEAAFYRKIQVYEKQLLPDNQSFTWIKLFHNTVLQNSLKCRYIHEIEALPQATLNKLNAAGTNFSSDTYLFEAALNTESKIIVTTDVKLRDQMLGDEVFKVILLADFLKTY